MLEKVNFWIIGLMFASFIDGDTVTTDQYNTIQIV